MSTEAALGVVHASVQVGNVETTYHRIGRGPPIVILDEGRIDLSASEIAPLARRWRFIAPDRTTVAALTVPDSGDGSPFTQWLDGFLEGLGMGPALVVAPLGLTRELRAFTASRPGLVAGLVLRGAAAGDAESWEEIPVRAVPTGVDWTIVADALEDVAG